MEAVLEELLEETNIKTKIAKKRRWGVHPMLESRDRTGAYHVLVEELRLGDEAKHFNYFRMNASTFEYLLGLVGPKIARAVTCRQPISASQRLALTLRFLASGDSFASLHYSYKVGLSTISNIVRSTCVALWEVLTPLVLPGLFETKDWIAISEGFHKLWNFPHCIGSIDGKHFQIQALPHSGSEYFNYKSFHSLMMLGVCDGNYIFKLVDIGGAGRQSDGGLFHRSAIGEAVKNGALHLPQPEPLQVGGRNVSFVLVGDEAFPLSENLMRPYPGQKAGKLDIKKCVFNYRLSRARRCIENAFGILVQRWRVLRRPLTTSKATSVATIQAAVVLHNMLRLRDIHKVDSHCTYTPSVDSENVMAELEIALPHAAVKMGGNRSSQTALELRDYLAEYFVNCDPLPWQEARAAEGF